MQERKFRVEGAHVGERFDKVVVALVPGLGRKGARRLFEEGKIRVNGKRPNKGDLARSGDKVTIGIADKAGPAATPEPDAPLVVRLENRAPGRRSEASRPTYGADSPWRNGRPGQRLGRPLPRDGGHRSLPREPGLLHRLDTDTSGLVVAARSREAFDELLKGSKGAGSKRAYLLICAARDLSSSGEVAIPIAHHPKDKKRMYPCSHPRDVARYQPRPAHTSVSRALDPRRVGPGRGARGAAIRHQIRVHMAAIGHPLAGDASLRWSRVDGLDRHALHASLCRVGSGEAVVPPFEMRSGLSADLVAAFPCLPVRCDAAPRG